MTALPRNVPSATELPTADWLRSSHSTGANNCVEWTGPACATLAVRDSKAPAGPALVFSPGSWASFTRALR